jgi:hypothetical protein
MTPPGPHPLAEDVIREDRDSRSPPSVAFIAAASILQGKE